jgi:hypothetical protein
MFKCWALRTKGSHLLYPCKQITEAKNKAQPTYGCMWLYWLFHFPTYVTFFMLQFFISALPSLWWICPSNRVPLQSNLGFLTVDHGKTLLGERLPLSNNCVFSAGVFLGHPKISTCMHRWTSSWQWCCSCPLICLSYQLEPLWGLPTTYQSQSRFHRNCTGFRP